LQIIGNQIIGKKNPFRYKGYYYDDETGLYLLTTRFYNPEWGRFLNADDVSYLDPSSINGLNLYVYCGNNPVLCLLRTWGLGDNSTHIGVSGVQIGNYNNVIIRDLLNSSSSRNNKLRIPAILSGFKIGLVTSEDEIIPKWMIMDLFYLNIKSGLFSDGKNLSLLNGEIGVANFGYKGPKWFKSLSEDSLLNPNVAVGFTVWKADGSVGFAGFSGKASFASIYGQIDLGNSLTIKGELYLGVGLAIDFSHGIKFGGGFFEASIEFSWVDLWNSIFG